MPVAIPNFNLTCNIWHGAIAWNGAFPVAKPAGAPSLSPVCQLYIPPLIYHGSWLVSYNGVGNITPNHFDQIPIILRLPKGTDVRSPQIWNAIASTTDAVECPAGSNRIYAVTLVEDLHKGFSNEYRIALLAWVYYYGAYPIP